MSEIDEQTKNVDPELLAVPEIKEAIELSEEVAYTKEELAAYITYWDTVSTEKILLEDKYQKGKIEGVKAIATILLADGTSIDKIKHLTGLTEAEIKILTNTLNK